MKKRILAVLACMVLALNMTACADNETSDQTSKKSHSEESKSSDNSDSKPDESKPDNSKPDDSKPESSKPTGSTPTESKPEANNPVDTIDWSTVPYADELDFMVEDVEGGVKITQYLGKEQVIKIPQTIGGKTVVELHTYNIPVPGGLIGINIPNSVTKIFSGSFSGCTQLKSVVLPDNYITNNYAFLSKCPAKNTVYTFLGKDYRLPEDQIILQDALFPGTGNVLINDKGELVRVSIAIKDVVIPDNVTSIRPSAFYNCDLIEDITIPGNVTEINFENVTGAWFFNNCPNLKSVTFAEGLTKIIGNERGSALFGGCPKLETVSLPESLTEIRGYAFGYCPALKSITLPDGLKHIDPGCFMYYDGNSPAPRTPEDLQVTFKGVTYKPNQFPNLYKAVNGN